MKKQELRFKSNDEKSLIHAVIWTPDNFNEDEGENSDIKGVLQITHGMVEFIERYEDFARFMTENGFIVAGHDHLGHGKSSDEKDWGYFAEKNPSDILVKDMHKLRRYLSKRYEGYPYFMLGHSMGSFLLRKYLSNFGEGLSGAIIIGTGSKNTAEVSFGKKICRILALKYGWHHKSRFVHKFAIGMYDSHFDEDENNCWITKDKEILSEYNANPACSFVFTLNGFYGLFDTIYYINKPSSINAIPKDLPILIASGDKDPVGDFGKGTKKAYETYAKAGIIDITLKLYENDRHEILNETDRDIVYNDILAWISERLI